MKKSSESHDRKLLAHYDKEHDVIEIYGNKAGLKYFAQWCLKVIKPGKERDHVLLQWQTSDLLKPSTSIIIQFTDSPEDYEILSKTKIL